MKPFPDEPYGRKPRHNSDSRSTLRAGVHRIYLPACVDGPSDARGKMSILTGGSTAIMCPACLCGYDRWPRWGPRSSPKHLGGFESLCTKRVLWIVGSTDRHLTQLFHPGINARSGGVRRLPHPPSRASSCPPLAFHLIEADQLEPLPASPMPFGPSRGSIPTETARRFDRLKLAKIEVTDRLQRFGGGAVSQVFRQGFQPGGILGLQIHKHGDGV